MTKVTFVNRETKCQDICIRIRHTDLAYSALSVQMSAQKSWVECAELRNVVRSCVAT